MKEKKVFIIEDDANILYGLESQFVSSNFIVGLSDGSEGEEATLSEAREFNPDYIVLDLILPRIEGFDLLRKIKSDVSLRDKDVFIFTDLSKKDSRERSLEMGADYVFFKEEFDTFAFAERVIKIIENESKGKDHVIDEDDDESGLHFLG